MNRFPHVALLSVAIPLATATQVRAAELSGLFYLDISGGPAALMLQARYRQHKAWVNVRAIRLVREEQTRLKERGANFSDPLGMMRDGLTMPCANATRLWQPPKFSACLTGDVDAAAWEALLAKEAKECALSLRLRAGPWGLLHVQRKSQKSLLLRIWQRQRREAQGSGTKSH